MYSHKIAVCLCVFALIPPLPLAQSRREGESSQSPVVRDDTSSYHCCAYQSSIVKTLTNRDRDFSCDELCMMACEYTLFVSILQMRRSLIGTRTADTSGVVVFNPTPGLSIQHDNRPVSLHVLIPTMGRPEIWRLLDSIKEQIEYQDMITVVFDGDYPHHVMENVQRKVKEMPGNNIVELAPHKRAPGDIGYSARNEHKSRGADFVLFADDDNFYEPHAFSIIRRTVRHDLDALYIFQVNRTDGPPIPDVWKNANTVVGNIDTGCGITPTKYAQHAIWVGIKYPHLDFVCCGDYYFYNAISSFVPRTYFIAETIYVHTGPHHA